MAGRVSRAERVWQVVRLPGSLANSAWQAKPSQQQSRRQSRHYLYYNSLPHTVSQLPSLVPSLLPSSSLFASQQP